jgi:Kef-type K+ transport system membrane component KefB
MIQHMGTTEVFLIAMFIILSVPFLVWKYLRTDYFAPMVVVQILMGIVLGPGVLGSHFPDYYDFVFSPTIIQSLNGIAWWAVMLFVFIAGLELDLTQAWRYRRESGITAGFALGTPLLLGCGAGFLLLQYSGWIGSKAEDWQFILGIGMSCAVTALPILVLLLEKLELLRQPIGQRILRYASLDDIMIWAVLALVLLDWERIGRQVVFLSAFAVAAWGFRKFLASMQEADRWYFSLIWLVAVAFAADWSGLHYMVGAFMAGAVIDAHMFDQKRMDFLRHNVLLIIMPVFFLSTGLKTQWEVGGVTVFLAAGVLLLAAIVGKLLGLQIAGKILRWGEGEASIIGWLLQTKALIMIIFANVLLDRSVITAETFTALLIMAVVSTMLTVPMVAPKIARNEALVAKVG